MNVNSLKKIIRETISDYYKMESDLMKIINNLKVLVASEKMEIGDAAKKLAEIMSDYYGDPNMVDELTKKYYSGIFGGLNTKEGRERFLKNKEKFSLDSKKKPSPRGKYITRGNITSIFNRYVEEIKNKNMGVEEASKNMARLITNRYNIPKSYKKLYDYYLKSFEIGKKRPVS